MQLPVDSTFKYHFHFDLFFFFFISKFANYLDKNHPMKRLSQHILSLLRLYDSVALPGVGFFSLEYISARYDSVESLFYPPFFSVSFEISYTADDDFLTDSYVRKENVSKDKAKAMVKEDVNRFLDLLDENHEVALEGIGTFVYLNDEIDFYPSFSLNVALPQIGISEIRNIDPLSLQTENIAPVEEEVEEPQALAEEEWEDEIEEDIEDNIPEISDEEENDSLIDSPEEVDAEGSDEVEDEAEEISASETESLQPVAHAPAWEQEEDTSSEVWKRKNKVPKGYYYHKPEYFYIPIHKYFANIAASVMLVVIVGLSAVLLAGSSCNQGGTASIVPISVADSEKNDSVITPSIEEGIPSQQKIDEDTVKNTTDKTENRYERPLLATDDNGEVVPGANSLPTSPYLQDETGKAKYFAVIAALGTQKEVNTFIEKHKDEMHKYKIIRNKKISLVTVSSSSDRKELESQMPLIREDYPKAWIFTLK